MLGFLHRHCYVHMTLTMSDSERLCALNTGPSVRLIVARLISPFPAGILCGVDNGGFERGRGLFNYFTVE
jgi:hypothetical protein